MSSTDEAPFSSQRKSVYSRALPEDGALKWDIPPPISQSQTTFGDKIGPFQHIPDFFEECLKSYAVRHLLLLTRQLLQGSGISNVEIWAPVILKLTEELTTCVARKQETVKGLLDARTEFKTEQLVDIGTPEDCCVIPGVVLRKNIAHKRMRGTINEPRVLLLAGALALECGNLLQLHTDIKKENDFLDSAIERISAIGPDVCVVEKSIARVAIERLKEANITLVSNVPMEDLTSLAIHTNAKIVQNVLELTEECLGKCQQFSLLPIRAATNAKNARKPFPLMIFKVVSGTVACTAVLRGASDHELSVVKEVLSFTVFAGYRLYLENAFITDCLSISAASVAAYGVEGFSINKWRNLCYTIVRDCVHRNQNHQKQLVIEFASPLVSQWTSHESHLRIIQKSEFTNPEMPSLCLESEIHEISSVAQTLTDSWEKMNDFAPYRSHRQNSSQQIPSHHLIKRAGHLNHNEDDCCVTISAAEKEKLKNFDKHHEHKTCTPNSQINNINNDYSNAHMGEEWCLWRTWSDVEGFRKLSASGEPYHGTCNNGYSVNAADLNKIYRQHFSASFASRNHRNGLLCEGSVVKSINFCSADDLSVYEFLMSIAADAPKRCSAGCGGGNSSHIRTFLHGGLRLTISLLFLPQENAFPNPKSDIWFWARPKGISTKPLPTISRIQLSEASKFLSLGQFLQLAFNTPRLEVFGRQLFVEHLLYFGYGCTVSCIYVDQISIKKVNFPSPIIQYDHPLQVQWVQEAGRQLLQEAAYVYGALERLCSNPQPSSKTIKSASTVKSHEMFTPECFYTFELIHGITEECKKFCAEVKTIIDGTNSEKVTNLNILETFLKLNTLWRQLGINALSCSATIHDPPDRATLRISSPFENSGSRIGTRVSAPVRLRSTINEKSNQDKSPSFGDLRKLGTPADDQAYSNSSPIKNKSDASISLAEARPWRADASISAKTEQKSPEQDPGGLAEPPGFAESPFMALVDQPFPQASQMSEALNIGEGSDDSHGIGGNLSIVIPSTASFSSYEGLERVPSINPLDQESGEGCSAQVRRNSSCCDIMELFDREAQLFHEESKLDPSLRVRSLSLPSSPIETTTLLEQLERRLDISSIEDGLYRGSTHGDYELTHDVSLDQQHEAFDSIPESPFATALSEINSKHSIPSDVHSKQTMTPVGAQNGIELSCRALMTSISEDLVIPVFEAEPVSIIAHVLSSITYHKDLQQCFENLSQQRQRIIDGSVDLDASIGGAMSESGFNRASGILDSIPIATNSTSRGRMKMHCSSHICQRVEDHPPGMPSAHARFEVISYFAPQFSKIRNRCIDGGERSFIMSMSRSKKWRTNGGKSKSYFSKTLDDRFIIKGLSKSEKASFLDRLGPCYFAYMEDQHKKNEDVALAKIFGLFQVSMKSTPHRNAKVEKMENGSEHMDLGRDWMLDVIVMENVFYNRDCISIYDLKGSHRKRYTDPATEKKNAGNAVVLLDTNLRKQNIYSPPFIISQSSSNGLSIFPPLLFPLSKLVLCLGETLRRDTDFLESNSVMDYSLLVGIDKTSNSLVVSIIDYCRQFTWDKRLESWVKSSGLMGESSEEPTIISPKSYQKRFISNILGYFTIVPLYTDIH